MWVLALDSATPKLGAALARLETEGEAAGSLSDLHLGRGEEGGGQHARRLPDLLLELLVDADLGLEEVDALVVGLGPGSFTGLRSGLATLNALAYGRGCPIVGVGSLPGYAVDAARALEAGGEALPAEALLVPCLDARRAEVYAATCGPAGDLREPLGRARTIAPAELLESLAGHPTEALFLFGPGGKAYPELAASPAWRPALPEHPTGAGLIVLAAPRLLAGESDDPLTLLPTYARKSEAERKLEAGELKIRGLTAPAGPPAAGREDID
ncbi:MAG: tRNA (adenosine(37)-N6)-threonylcarbamoyltransferase complex dimerization subunit type 1 TsaB [Deltaproteobacteria bacterium]|nr:tRNA (adenosine(37)-N6)-threonylcarbamoyltransferase complex dimerization subunit type 1 TsaB [Deltaproteobacteria bacterium]